MGIPNIGLNPNIILQGTSEPQTPELQTPAQNMDALARIRQYQQQAALAPLKMQEAKNAVDEGTQKVQAASRVQQYQSAISQILAKNSSTDPTTGGLKVNQDAVMDGLNKAGFGPEGIKYDADRRADLKSAFDASEQQYKIQGAQNARLGALAASVPTVDWTNPDTDAVAAQKLAAQTRARYALQTALKEKVIDPQYEAKIESQLQNYGPDVEAQLQQFSNSAMDAAKQKEQALAIHKDTRDALLFPSQLDKSKADATKAQTEAEAAEVAAAIKKLSQAKTVEAYAQILGDLPHRIAVQVPPAPGQAQPVSTPPVQPPPSTAALGPPASVAGTPNAVPTSVMAPAVPATGAPPQANTNVGSGAGPAPAGAPVSTAPSQPIPPQPQSVPAAPVAAPPPVTAPAQPGGTPLPEGFSKSLLESGMTPEQIAQSRQRANTITEPELAARVAAGKAPNATADEITRGIAAEAALKRLDQSKKDSRPITSFNAPLTLAQRNADAQMAVDGKLTPQTIRAALRKDPSLLSDIQAIDPKFDEGNLENRYQTLKEFNNTSVSKAGGQSLALNTLIHHADLYMQAAHELHNGSFKPGNAIYNAVASTFGSAPPQTADLLARFFASETGKVATGGVPAEGEINGILKNLANANSDSQIDGAGNALLHVASGRAIPLIEKAKKANIDGIVDVIGPDAKEILTRHGYDPNTMKPVNKTTVGTVNPNPNGYVAGHVYGGMTFLGGDPNNKASWKQ